MREIGGDLRHRTRLVAILVALLVSGVALAEGSQNDAGLGLDAGNSVETASALNAWGVFSASFDANDSTDWYRQTIAQPAWNDTQCVEASPSATTTLNAYVVAVTAGGDTREAVARVAPARTNFVGVATPGARGAFFRVNPDAPTNSSYQLSLGRLGLADIGANDGWGVGDAPNTAAWARPITRGCFGGKVGSTWADPSDAYGFSGQPGDKIVVTLTDNNSASRVQLYSPTSALLGTIQPGEAAAFTLPMMGTYTLTATSPGAPSTTYVVGLCEPDCGPPANPCRPMCVLLLGD